MKTTRRMLRVVIAAGLVPAALGAAPAKPAWQSAVVTAGLVDIDVKLDKVKRLWLVVDDGGDGYACDWADWLEPRVETPGGVVKLAGQKWVSGSTGFGQLQVGKNAVGGPLKVDGKVYEEGIGAHAYSVVCFDLPEGATRFTAKGALDDGGTSQHGGSTVRFMVYTQQPPAPQQAGGGGGDGGRGSGWEAAEQAQQQAQLGEGLEARLFASEPMIYNPTNLDVDARGRVWVTEGSNYRGHQNNRPEGDRIVILEDSDRDGRADKATTFYQNPEINAALGICVLGNRVVVSCSPNILVLTDTDGDGKCDKREVLFTKIGGTQHDHGVHAVSFGPDGKLYFNMGDAGEQLCDAQGKPVVDMAGNEVNNRGKPYRKGMVFRCNLDGSELEVLGHNFRNNYEVAADSFGTLWQSDNDDDGNKGVRINYVMEYGNFGYSDELTGAGWNSERTNREAEIPSRHWYQNDPGVVPNLLITGQGSPCGMLVYEGDLLPARFRNQVIHCDNGPRVVRAYPVEKRGAGFTASMESLMTSSDAWFRPDDVCAAPDGSLFVSDWYDPGVGGHGMGDNNMETMRGRIYRIAPSGNKLAATAKPDLTTAAGRIAALRSPNIATRYLAWSALRELGGKAEKELVGLWKTPGNDPLVARHRARALQLLARIDGRGAAYVAEALKDPNPDIRLTGLRVARSAKMDVIPLVAGLVGDPAPEVRRECAIALRKNPSPKAAQLWAQLAARHDSADRWYLEALGIGAQGHEAEAFDAWLAQVGEKWNTPAGRDIIWRSRAPKAASYLAKIILDPSTPEAERPRYIRALDFLSGPEKDAALIEMLGAGK